MMRLVTIPMEIAPAADGAETATAIVYPGDSADWGRTWRDGANLVGEYRGDLPLDDYTGSEFPPRDYRGYCTRFRRDDWLDALTGTEIDGFNTYLAGDPHPVLVALFARINLRNGWFDVRSDEYQNTMALLLAEGLLSVSRRDEMLYGIPV